MEMELSHTLDTTAGCSFSSADPIYSVTEQECVSAATQTVLITYVNVSTQTTEPLHLKMLCDMEASSQNCSTPVKSLEPGFSHLHFPNPNLTSSYVLCALFLLSILKSLLCDAFGNLQCTAPISTIRHAFNGSMITVQTICNNHHEYSCRSQPVVNKFSLSHVMLSAAILLAGNTFHTISKIAEVSGIKLFSKRTFY